MMHDIAPAQEQPEPRQRAARHGRRCCETVFHHTLPGTAEAVRETLVQVDAALRSGALAQRLSPDGMGDFRTTVELVLAEVLNNIVEHAFAARPGADDPETAAPAQMPKAQVITLDLHLSAKGMRCVVFDTRGEMPLGRLPAGHCPDIALARDDLAEGGYGWFLIRALTQDLHYARWAGGNRLSFGIPLVATDIEQGAIRCSL